MQRSKLPKKSLTDSNTDKDQSVAADALRKDDNAVFNKDSISSLIKAVEIETPNFGLALAMYLGVPTLTIIKLKEELEKTLGGDDDGQIGEAYFRDWYNSRKRYGKPLDRYKELYSALNHLDQPMMAEIFQQRYMDEQPMKFDDFVMVLKEKRGRPSDAGWI